MSLDKGNTSYNDHRVIVILIFCISVMLRFGLPLLNESEVNDSSNEAMILRQNGDSLLCEKYETENSGPRQMDINPELTPFFFAPVKVSRASKDMLMTLPGIGSGIADRIIEYRTSHDGIDSGLQFMQVQGIGKKRYASLRDYISFE